MAASVFSQGGQISSDGTCGGAAGQICTGSAFGNCCSSYGYCGNTTAHCGGGCQPNFGTCDGINYSPDGSCGPTFSNYICTPNFGNCCSGSGYCGNSTAYCGAGCQGSYSTTGACLTTGVSSVDGSCGGTNGYTCTGGAFDGQCCSAYGWCGSDTAHCSAAAGCQSAFGAPCT
ncbi:hypothetical protein L873DRAFT_1715215 [Choiromyces venosus 120613-1]|uniref:Chitin-binding type-1 domain-containing protein n=1 Tax=Choiromyces venosus 120613-1 TaxID=1336337 RepID=A0A3N4J275_9PEZI|nr:hypothetical protein L873DRAFT_1715215 [Choiromyces venosus 120613-1]